MTVVSDTSPLNYLVLIGAIESPVSSTASSFRKAWRVSSRTISRRKACVPGSRTPPPWLEARAPAAPDPTMMLDFGEREALSLALELEAALVLLDDKAARTVAKDRGIPVVGTLAVLELASQRGLVDLPDALEALTSTSFRVRKDVIEALLTEHTRRKKHPRRDKV